FRRPALADADAADSRMREVALVLRIGELHRGAPGLVVGAEPQVLIDLVRVDDLAPVHLQIRVPDALELAEAVHEVVPEHLRQELGARLPVAVLAGERTAQLEHEVARVLEPAAVLLDSLARHEVEVPACVHTALAVVAVQRALVLVLPRELLQAAQVLAEALRRDGGVLPALVRVLLAGDEGGRAEAR